MKRGVLAVAVLLASVGCSGHGGGVVTIADAATPEPDVNLATSDAPPSDLPGDGAPADAGPVGPAEDAYRDFVSMFNDGYNRRLVSCFNFAASSLAGSITRELFDDVRSALRIGLAGWDAAQAARCLAALATAPCEEIASGRALAACDRVLVGRVPDDGYCLNDQDCAQPGRVCGSSGLASCGRVCVRSLRPPADAVADGQDCLDENCQAGLYCRVSAFGQTDGTCRPIAPGAACDSRWQCPHPYTCVGPGPAMGTCGVGKAAGERCHNWSDRPAHGADSDCSPTSNCTANGAGPEVCVPGPASTNTAPTELAPGAACLSDDLGGHCQLGNFCRFDPAELMKDPPPAHFQGVCEPWRKSGAFCEYEGACGPGLTCLHGTCTACPGGVVMPSDGGTDAGARDGGCSANLKADPANCGACGQSCQGGACLDGHCQPRAIGTGLDRTITGLAVDDSGVYLTEDDQAGRLLRVTPDGSQPYQVLASDQNRPQGIALDATHAYWVDDFGNMGGSVSRVAKSGGPVEILAAMEAGPHQIAIDDTHVYWTNPTEGPAQGLRRVAKLGGAPEFVVAGGAPAGLALDATDVYWCDPQSGTVNRRSKTGGPIKVLASGESEVAHILVDDRRVIWSTSDHVASVPKDGGPVTVVAPMLDVADLATDGESVYWSTNFEIGRGRPGQTLQLFDGVGVGEIEVRGSWIYFVTDQTLLRLPR